MVTRLTTSLSRRDTLSVSAPRFGAGVRSSGPAPARCAAFVIALLVMFAILSVPAVASSGYPDNTFASVFLLAWELGVGRR